MSLLHCGTMAMGLAALVMPGVTATARIVIAAILSAVLSLGMAKGYIRTLVARELFRKEIAGTASCYWQLAPLISWIMLANFVVSSLTRRMEWCGTVYELVSPDHVRIISRTEA